MIRVPLFDLKFLNELAAGGVGTFKSAALKRIPIKLNRSFNRPNQECALDFTRLSHFLRRTGAHFGGKCFSRAMWRLVA